MNPLISIAMTTYNGEKYLAEQLDSILSQTYSDFELIICDDCSKDSTVEIVQEYCKKDSRVKLFVNEKNLGFKKNFEKAISLCSGDYVALADQDDIWHKDHIEFLFNNIKGNFISCANANIMVSNGNIVDVLSNRNDYYRDTKCLDRLYFILFNKNPFQGASCLLSKEFLKHALPVPESIKYHDAWFCACACALESMVFSFKPITDYRLHEINASGKHENITFLYRVKRLKSKAGTIRLNYCLELEKQFPELPEKVKDIIKEAKQWHTNRINNQRWKNLPCLVKNYKKIYGTNSYKLLGFRIITALVRGFIHE